MVSQANLSANLISLKRAGELEVYQRNQCANLSANLISLKRKELIKNGEVNIPQIFLQYFFWN